MVVNKATKTPEKENCPPKRHTHTQTVLLAVTVEEKKNSENYS